ncbi:hypothetical protein HMPREF6745_2558 [Prevotella sp. oral taxon 472 str. F0295]|nr:hypothetical protein HMPREF6745_2558 [Prevotella sp. oral taxon 472 str. F0295]
MRVQDKKPAFLTMCFGKEYTYWANRHTMVATGKYIYKQTHYMLFIVSIGTE